MDARRVLLVVLLLGAACDSRQERCFTASDETAGWKRAAIPPEAPALAAPEGVEQFRGAEAAVVWADARNAYAGAYESQHRAMAYRFVLEDASSEVLMVTFSRPLDGVKVDAVGYEAGRAYPLLDGKRVRQESVLVDWDGHRFDSVVVTVHRHARKVPIVRSWRVGRWAVLGGPAAAIDGLGSGALYYRHPGGRRIVLCDLPGRLLSVDGPPAGEPPLPVKLTPAHSRGRLAQLACAVWASNPIPQLRCEAGS